MNNDVSEEVVKLNEVEGDAFSLAQDLPEGEKGEEKNVEQIACFFKVYWSDEEISDPKLINYYKILLREIIDQNKLLGKFDDFGVYTIDVDIRRELARMYKDIFDIFDGGYKAKAIYMDKEFSFVVDLLLLDGGMARADLYLVEEVVGLHEHTFKTFVATFTSEMNGDFNLRVKKAFRLVDFMSTLHDTDIPNIAILLQGQIDNGIFLDELIELGSQIFVLRMLEELEKCGEIGKSIVEEFKARMQEEDEKPPQEKSEEKQSGEIEYKHKVNKKFTSMRHKLDEIVEKKGGYASLPLEKEVKDKIFEDFNAPVEKVEDLRKAYRDVESKSKPTAKSTQTAVPAKAIKDNVSGGKSAPKAKPNASNKAAQKKPTKDTSNDNASVKKPEQFETFNDFAARTFKSQPEKSSELSGKENLTEVEGQNDAGNEGYKAEEDSSYNYEDDFANEVRAMVNADKEEEEVEQLDSSEINIILEENITEIKIENQVEISREEITIENQVEISTEEISLN